MSASPQLADPDEIPRYERRGDVPEGLYTASQLSRGTPRRVPLPDAQPSAYLHSRGNSTPLYRLEHTRIRYSSIEAAPDDLYSKTALAHLDPPRKPAPGAVPAAEATYHGNQTAQLFPLGDTVLKRTATPQERTRLGRARHLQHVCQRCDARTYPAAPDEPPPPGVKPWGGRLCVRCSAVTAAHGHHLARQTWARQTMTSLAGRTPLVVVADNDHTPRRLALVAFPALRSCDDRWEPETPRLLADLALTLPGADPEPGHLPCPDAIRAAETALHGLEEPASLIGWTNPRRLLTRLAADGRSANTPGEIAHPTRPWLDPYHPDALPYHAVRESWTYWHYEPHPGYGPEGMEPTTRWRPDPHWRQQPPGLDPHNLLEGASLLIGMLAQVADGTAPVHAEAPWLFYPPTASGYNGP
ncbi:hypothetical protein OG339_48840 (plasmid) [Streptosporangium sp. NBC_01495]|uniref:hypothetical protein n=1 Tax=Streptosporangium sp. NBC_01495 TaxID=2903899 RepID=UPI002E36E1E4|nr:hypothetical protein [Streptosporangium sp. NBC_01495]